MEDKQQRGSHSGSDTATSTDTLMLTSEERLARNHAHKVYPTRDQHEADVQNNRKQQEVLQSERQLLEEILLKYINGGASSTAVVQQPVPGSTADQEDTKSGSTEKGGA